MLVVAMAPHPLSIDFLWLLVLDRLVVLEYPLELVEIGRIHRPQERKKKKHTHTMHEN